MSEHVTAHCCRGETPDSEVRPESMLGLTQLSNYPTLKGSFSAVSKPNFASKYSLELGSMESSHRDLQNALLCTVLECTVLESI